LRADASALFIALAAEDLIEEKMGAQLLVIKQNADWVIQLRRVGPGHGCVRCAFAPPMLRISLALTRA
jgi:hypothetical protein